MRTEIREKTAAFGQAARGFTLLEVLLSLGLVIVLMGAMTGFLIEMVGRRTSLARGMRDIDAADAFIEQIEDDVLAGLAGGTGIGAGVKGSATGLRLLTRGVSIPMEGAFDHAELLASEFEFDARSARLSGRRGSVAGGGGSFEVISDRFERVKFRYFDGRAWHDEFDALEAKRLPAAIEVSVWVTSVGNTAAPVRERMTTAMPTTPSEEKGTTEETAESEKDANAAGTPAFVWGPPDRRRVVVIPDAPDAEWGSTR